MSVLTYSGETARSLFARPSAVSKASTRRSLPRLSNAQAFVLLSRAAGKAAPAEAPERAQIAREPVELRLVR